MENDTSKELKNIKFFLVVYLSDGSGHFYPQDTKEQCKELLEHIKTRTKWKDKYKDFRIIKRNMDNYSDGLIL